MNGTIAVDGRTDKYIAISVGREKKNN